MVYLLRSWKSLACSLLVLALTAGSSLAQDGTKPASQEELIKQLEKTLTGAKMTGRFTVLGKEDKAPDPEEYTIVSAKKMPDGDIWIIQARIKYGKTDKTLPIPLEIQWAGDTPVITMTDMAVPGLGTFSTRVVIYDGMYAGTWQHGPVKGHLFGTITPSAKTAENKPADSKPANGK
jgi:hypothetical protein